MPQAARLVGRSPGHARRERDRAGGTGLKATGRRLAGLVHRYQKKSQNVMWLLHSQKGLNAQRNREVEPGFGVFEVQTGDLPDTVEAVAKRVRVHAELLRRVLLLAGFEVGPERGDQGALAGGVVLDERTEVAPAVVDEALVADGGEQPGQPELGHRHDLPPPLEAGQRLHHRGDLAQCALDGARRLDRGAEPDRDCEARLPLADRLLDLKPKGVAFRLGSPTFVPSRSSPTTLSDRPLTSAGWELARTT